MMTVYVAPKARSVAQLILERFAVATEDTRTWDSNTATADPASTRSEATRSEGESCFIRGRLEPFELCHMNGRPTPERLEAILNFDVEMGSNEDALSTTSSSDSRDPLL